MTQIAQALRLSPLPVLESRMLMQRVTGLSRVQLLTRDTDALTAAQLAVWNQLLERRLHGEPMAYILGEREFYGRMFAVNSDVLIPRPDTEILIDAVLDAHAADETHTVLDLGTGSGAIAVTLAAERPNWCVTAVDLSQAALAVAQTNADAHAPTLRLRHSDWFSAFTAGERFDLIVSNPPYIAVNDAHLTQGDLRFEPRGALSDEADGLQHYRAIIAQAPQFLNANGCIYLEHGFEQGIAVRELLYQADFTDICTLRDLAGHERVSWARMDSKE